MSLPRPPYFGAAYYPEDWPLAQIDEDIALMLRANMNCMRVGEFAWSSMEPDEGRYEFGWLHTVVDKLAAAGIATILGTPSATPPIWLVERYPEVLFVMDDGRPSGHGARRHTCPNSPVYRDHCARIVGKMAEEFGQDDRILGWQIDNEVYAIGGWPPRSCCCPVCLQLFREKMRTEFGTIEALNDAWCLNLWSQAYQSFDQLPIPRRDIWHHPSFLAAWSDFTSDSYVAFCKHQADLLHEKTKHPIGTDMMPFSGVDYVDMHRALDLVQFNHYNEMDNLWRVAFWFDFLRPLKPAPFWNTETQTSWNGSMSINGGVKDPGWCRANSWLPIALGGEANLYWLWRQHWAGQELMHGAVVASSGRPLYMFDEVAEIGHGFAAASDFLAATRPAATGLALLWSQKVARMQQNQPILPNFQYESALQDLVYRPMMQAQLRPDLITADADLSAYSIIVAPFLLSLDEAGLREHLRTWVEAGGTLVIGPLSDVRNKHAAKFTHAPFGSLEEWAGVTCPQSIPGFPRDYEIRWAADGHTCATSLWCDALDPREAEAMATYLDGPNAGFAAVTRRAMGRGQVILLGTMPLGGDVSPLLMALGARPVAEASDNLLVVPREGETARGLIAVELEGKPAWLDVEGTMRDVVTGAAHTGRLDFPPYAVIVLQA